MQITSLIDGLIPRTLSSLARFSLKISAESTESILFSTTPSQSWPLYSLRAKTKLRLVLLSIYLSWPTCIWATKKIRRRWSMCLSAMDFTSICLQSCTMISHLWENTVALTCLSSSNAKMPKSQSLMLWFSVIMPTNNDLEMTDTSSVNR